MKKRLKITSSNPRFKRISVFFSNKGVHDKNCPSESLRAFKLKKDHHLLGVR